MNHLGGRLPIGTATTLLLPSFQLALPRRYGTSSFWKRKNCRSQGILELLDALMNRDLLTVVLYISLATAVLVLALVLLAIAFRKIYRKIEAWQERRRLAVSIQKLELLKPDQITSLLLFLTRVFRAVLTIFVLDIYVSFVLSYFPGTDPLPRPLVYYILAPVLGLWVAFVEYLPKLIYILVVVVIARYGLKLIHFVFRAIESGIIVVRGFHTDWAEITYKIVRVAVLFLVLIAVFPHLPGANSEFFSGVSLFVGALITLGSSTAIANIFAGLFLIYSRAFRAGDWVEIGATTGRVIEMNLLVTRLQTPKNETITIPNGTVLRGALKNFSELSSSSGLILHTFVSIGYDVDWRVVHELLLSAAAKTPHVLNDPKPFVRQESLDDFTVTYELNAYTDDPTVMPGTYSELHRNVLEAFNRAQVEIMSPHYRATRSGDQAAIPKKSPSKAPRDD